MEDLIIIVGINTILTIIVMWMILLILQRLNDINGNI